MTPPDDEQAVTLLHQMLGIASPSGAEAELAGFLAGALDGLGFASHIDEAGNLIADIGLAAGGSSSWAGTGGSGGSSPRAGTTGPVLMLLSHLDTVDRPLPARRTAAALHGRGAVDAKGPLAVMIVAAARRARFPGIIRVIGAVEEERLSRGGHHVARTQPVPDWLIIGEPGGWSSLALGYKGKIDIGFRVQAAPTHSTNPVPKATELAAGFWLALRQALGPELDHGRFHVPAVTLRRMGGDLTQAYLDVDCRVPPGFDVAAFTAALRSAAGSGELDIVRYIPAVRAPRGNPVARCLAAGIRSSGGQPRPLLKTGTSDMNTVAACWQVPMAAYGPGDSSLDHGDAEHLPIAEYLTAIRVLTECIDELARSEIPALGKEAHALPDGGSGTVFPQRG